MDDYTWQKKLKERQTRSHRWQLLLFLCVAIAIGTAAWYFGFFSRTPEYALEQAKLSVRSHKEKGWDDPKYWAAFILLDALD